MYCTYIVFLISLGNEGNTTYIEIGKRKLKTPFFLFVLVERRKEKNEKKERKKFFFNGVGGSKGFQFFFSRRNSLKILNPPSLSPTTTP